MNDDLPVTPEQVLARGAILDPNSAAAIYERQDKQMAIIGKALNEMTNRLHQQDNRIAELLLRIAVVERSST